MSFLLIFFIIGAVSGVPIFRGEKPVSVVAFIRHGDRTPVKPYPTDPWKDPKYWPVPFGELTDTGIRQEYEFGQRFRRHYKHLLPDKYDPNEIYVISSDSDRTLASAQSNLAGMFPVNESTAVIPGLLWRPVPVHSIPIEVDDIMIMHLPCPKYDEVERRLFATRNYVNFFKTMEPIYDYLTKHSGLLVNNPRDAYHVIDVLRVERLNNYTLPDWAANFTDQFLKTMSLAYFTLDTSDPALSRLKVGPLLKEVVEHIHHIRDGKKFHKVKLYNGHDLTLVRILNSLGLLNNRLPPYASSVIFEIYEENRGIPARIRILYQFKPLFLGDRHGYTYPAEEWISDISHLIPENHRAECQREINLGKKKEENELKLELD